MDGNNRPSLTIHDEGVLVTHHYTSHPITSTSVCFKGMNHACLMDHLHKSIMTRLHSCLLYPYVSLTTLNFKSDLKPDEVITLTLIVAEELVE
uniref:Bm14476 n=2 Tax=Brugia TaxID=6278 RepID=A0A1S0T0E2_BRUMA|nr:Bm14476 [Brugia malayi]